MDQHNHVVHQQILAGKGGQPAYTLKNKFSKWFHRDTIEEPFFATEEHLNEQFLKEPFLSVKDIIII